MLGNLVGSWIAYAVGYFGRVDLIEKHGRKVQIKPHHLKWADDWFARYGDATVFFSRLLPIIRTFISLPAGVAKMPFWRFTAFTVAGCVPWVFALAFVGRRPGPLDRWKDHLHYVDYAIVAAVVLGLVWLIVRSRRRRVGAARPEAEARAARPAARPRRAAPRLVLRPRRRAALAARLGDRALAGRAAQGARGRAARRHRARAGAAT